MDKIRAIYREPFSLGSPIIFDIAPGVSVDALVTRLPLPEGFVDRGVVRINDVDVPRALWASIKPKPNTDLVPVNVTFHLAPQGGGGGADGGGGGGKDILALVAGLALAVATSFIAGGGLASVLGASFGAGTIGATALAAGVSLVGSLLLGGLSAPPSVDRDTERDGREPASASGNLLEPNGSVPRVLGTRRVYPPLAGEPIVYYSGGDEYVEAVYALAGPHDLDDIKLDGTPLVDAEDIEFETREGWSDDLALTLVTRQGRSTSPQTELSTHIVDPDNQDILDPDAVAVSDNLPLFHPVASRDSPDEMLLQVIWPEGLNIAADDTIDVRIPFRTRIRKQGDVAWINIPEFHYENSSLRQERATIRFIFDTQPGGDRSVPPTSAGWVEARKNAPGQTAAPTTTDWDADSYFSAGVGNDYYDATTSVSTLVDNIDITSDEIKVYLDPATFDAGVYEIETKRGYAFKDSLYVASTYLYDTNSRDFFAYYTDGSDSKIALTRKGLAETCYMARLVSIWNSDPIGEAGLSLIAIRAKNRRVEKLSVSASGYVRDWSGSAWDTYTTTSNPAPHYRDILAGDLNFDPLPEALIDDTELVAWRTACTASDYTCDLIVEGSRVSDTLRLVAGTGYARPYQSEIWGVIRDRDRSADTPVQIFTPRNSNDLKFKKAFSRLPDGFRVNYRDGSADNNIKQTIVYRAGETGSGSRLEQISYDGIIDTTKVRARGTFDLRQAEYRSTFYELSVPVESIVARRGDLIGVQSDILHTQAGFGRITAVTIDGGTGKITAITLDSEVNVSLTNDMHTTTDMHAVTDMHDVGLNTGVAIRRTDGSITVHKLSNTTGFTDVLTFDTPLDNLTTAGGPFDAATINQVDTDCLVATGLYGVEYQRLIISSIIPGRDLTATLTLIDEAPELWA